MPPETKFPLVPIATSSTEIQKKEAYVEDAMVEASDLYVPTLKVLQGVSDEVKAGKCMPGRFWNPYTQKPLESPQRVLIVFHQKSRWMRELNDPKIDSKMHHKQCMSFDTINGTEYGKCEECSYKDWKDRNPPECSMSHIFVAMTPEGPLAVRFRKKAEKNAKQYITSKLSQRENWWAFMSVVEIKKEIGEDDSGRPADYFAPTIAWDKTQPVSDELRAQARAFNSTLQAAQAAGRLKAETVEEGQ